MKLAIEHVPTIAVITATGDPQAEEENLFSEAVEKLLDGGVCNIVLDLSSLASIDSHAVGDMVAAYLKATQQDSKLVLVIPRRHFGDRMSQVWQILRTGRDGQRTRSRQGALPRVQE